MLCIHAKQRGVGHGLTGAYTPGPVPADYVLVRHIRWPVGRLLASLTEVLVFRRLIQDVYVRNLAKFGAPKLPKGDV